jgi:hypothetical protein
MASTRIHLPDPVHQQTSGDDLMRTIARRMATTEPRARTYTTAVLLSALARPRRENGVTAEFVIREHWLRRYPRERGINFFYFASRAAALAAWPTAKSWPWPYAEPKEMQ